MIMVDGIFVGFRESQVHGNEGRFIIGHRFIIEMDEWMNEFTDFRYIFS